MYMALLRSCLVIPLEKTDHSEEMGYVKDEALQGLPVYVAFTSEDAMKKWRPEHTDGKEIDATDFFLTLQG